MARLVYVFDEILPLSVMPNGSYSCFKLIAKFATFFDYVNFVACFVSYLTYSAFLLLILLHIRKV
jgi:hypothetical protein